ncbi:MAG TPA: cupin domain-containing protein [Holophagaceae bacterium]|nr:cupin domain-containing protein [Holophagaceae bacterium]
MRRALLLLALAPAIAVAQATRVTPVFAHALPKMASGQMRMRVLEVRYGPGGSSLPHRHPCPVMVYVLEGAIRSQVEGEPEAIYRAGESFYEAPNAIHRISANASRTEPARFLAVFICDHEAELSEALPGDKHP